MRIVDGNNLLHRIADGVGYGIHPVRQAFTRFCSPPETTILVWDGPYANKRRQEVYPGYKSKRRPPEESKHKFFELAKGVLRLTPTIQVEIPGWEADDIIGTLVNRWHKDHQIVVETNDGDYWQHSDKCHLPLVSKKWHPLTPDECLLYKSLVGDSKDDIPGLKGFGDKSWESLSKEDRQTIVRAVRGGNSQLLFATDSWPSKVKRHRGTLDEIQLFWKLNHYWDVPVEEIDKHMFHGKQNIAAAEIFMEGYLI